MKSISVTILILVALSTAFAQDNRRAIQTYERKVIPRPFFVRWAKGLIGPTFGQLEKLQLKSDGTFYYSYRDRYCGTFNYEGMGTWKKIDNRLTLQPNDQCCVPWTNLLIEKGKLYSSVDSLINRTWAMKKKLF
jgi:hypothetical protein